MSKIAHSAFKSGFIKRTATARKRMGMSQDEIATLLGLTQGTYKNYELDRCLPHHFIPTFCRLTNIEFEWLYSGKVARVAHHRKLTA